MGRRLLSVLLKLRLNPLHILTPSRLRSIASLSILPSNPTYLLHRFREEAILGRVKSSTNRVPSPKDHQAKVPEEDKLSTIY